MVLVLLALLAVPARAQQKNLTLDNIYNPAKRVNFGSVAGTYTWLSDKEYVKLGSARGGPAPTAALTRVNADAGTGRRSSIRRSWKLLSRNFPELRRPTPRSSLASAPSSPATSARSRSR